jgi:alpha-N-arabinofuranosidase
MGPLTQQPGRPGTWDCENTDGLGLVRYLQVRISLAQRQ